jgi:hypothetical protein
MRTEPLSEANEQAALRYLSRSPYLNVFITHVLLHDPPSRTRSDVVVATDGGGVHGVAGASSRLRRILRRCLRSRSTHDAGAASA